MEITKDTDLSEIINNSDISSLIDSSLSTIESTISEREGLIDTALQDSSVSNFQLNGENTISDGLTTNKENYSTLSSDMKTFKSTVVQVAKTKELEELNDLLTAVVEAINDAKELASSYNHLSMSLSASCGMGVTQAILDQINEYTENAKAATAEAEQYEEKKFLIEQRISEVGGAGAGSLYNVMSTFELDENGKPTTIPLDFTIDSHHRLDIPGWGCFYEASWGGEIEFHYNSDTNMFYFSDSGTDWSTYDYSSDIYGITPEDMLNSAIKGGICPG